VSADRAAAPSGVVTFLFTDVEGSTSRWEKDADGMRVALAAHDEVLRSAFEGHDGFCSATPVPVWLLRSRRRGRLSMLRSPRSGRWSCRSGWGWRPVRQSCATGTTSERCSTDARHSCASIARAGGTDRGHLRLARARRSGVHHADLCALAERRVEEGCGHFAEGCDTLVTPSQPSNTLAACSQESLRR
jgi:hypothetical protein